LPRVDRPAWDADAIAVARARSPVARARNNRLKVTEVPVLRFDDEHRAADADLAARHDNGERLGWLAGRLREGLALVEGTRGILLGPWLGAAAPRAEALSATVGVPCGEALVGAGSPAGHRFEAARDRLLDALGAKSIRDRALRVARSDGEGDGSRFTITLAGGASVHADAVVLATGGLAGGGLIYAPPEHGARVSLPPEGKVPFELSAEAPVALSFGRSERLGIVGSMQGPELDLVAWPQDGRAGALEAVGVQCEGVLAAPGIAVAGDLVAGRPRTVLEAVTSGLAAGSFSSLTR
jgi:glycerol-3-phosphate dehydrogenase subunit B